MLCAADWTLFTEHGLGRVGRIHQNSHTGKARRHAAQHLEKLRAGVGSQGRKSGDIASGVCQALDESVADRVGRGTHDDGYRAGCSLRRAGGDRSCCHDDIHFQSYQVVRQAGKALDFPLGRPGFDQEIPAVDVTEIAHPPRECGLQAGFLTHCQKTNAPDPALRLTESAGRRHKCERARSKRSEKFSAIIHYAPLVGHYARLRQGQQPGECLIAGGTIDGSWPISVP